MVRIAGVLGGCQDGRVFGSVIHTCHICPIRGAVGSCNIGIAPQIYLGGTCALGQEHGVLGTVGAFDSGAAQRLVVIHHSNLVASRIGLCQVSCHHHRKTFSIIAFHTYQHIVHSTPIVRGSLHVTPCQQCCFFLCWLRIYTRIWVIWVSRLGFATHHFEYSLGVEFSGVPHLTFTGCGRNNVGKGAADGHRGGLDKHLIFCAIVGCLFKHVISKSQSYVLANGGISLQGELVVALSSDGCFYYRTTLQRQSAVDDKKPVDKGVAGMECTSFVHYHSTTYSALTSQCGPLVYGIATCSVVLSVYYQSAAIDSGFSFVGIGSGEPPVAISLLDNVGGASVFRTTARPVVDDSGKGLVGIGSTDTPCAAEAIGVFRRTHQIGSRCARQTTEGNIGIGRPGAHAGIALGFNHGVGNVLSVNQQQTTVTVAAHAIGYQSAGELYEVGLNILTQIGDIELQIARTCHRRGPIAVTVGGKDAGSSLFHLHGEGIGFISFTFSLSAECTSSHHQLAGCAYASLGDVGCREI